MAAIPTPALARVVSIAAHKSHELFREVHTHTLGRRKTYSRHLSRDVGRFPMQNRHAQSVCVCIYMP